MSYKEIVLNSEFLGELLDSGRGYIILADCSRGRYIPEYVTRLFGINFFEVDYEEYWEAFYEFENALNGILISLNTGLLAGYTNNGDYVIMRSKEWEAKDEF